MTSARGVQGVSAPRRGSRGRWATPGRVRAVRGQLRDPAGERRVMGARTSWRLAGCETGPAWVQNTMRRKTARNKRLQRAAATCLPPPPTAVTSTCGLGRGIFGGPHPVAPRAVGHSREMLGDAVHLLGAVQLPRSRWPKHVCVCSLPSILPCSSAEQAAHPLAQSEEQSKASS